MAVRSVLSCNGRVELRRGRYARADGGSDAPVDDLIDLAHSGISLAVREMCCRIATDSASFARAAQLKLSDEKLRQVVEAEGKAVLAWQEHEQLELDFEAGGQREARAGGERGSGRIYTGIDGFMLPMITDGEKAKRYAKAVERRRRLPRKRGVRRRRLVRRQGADQRYKEFKLVSMYDQEQIHKHVRVTRRGPQQVGRMIRQMSEDVGLHRAGEVVAVTDGAEWIARQIEQSLPKRTTAILDFYHASEHVHQARRAVFGEEDAEGRQWAGEVIEQMLKGSFEQWWQTLVQTRGRLRSPAKRRAMDELMHYLLSRREKTQYAAYRARGLDIGSGVTESCCKSAARRLKGVGMRWNAPNAEAMTALEALHQSDLWPTYWQSSLKRAA